VADVERFPKDNLFYFNRGQSIAELLSSHVPKNHLRILDIGAGYGHILHCLGERFPGSERYAIEFSEPCIRHLQSLNVKVETRPVEQVLSGKNEHFDLITISHVLEHLLDPKTVLNLIHSSLAKEGVLYVEVPNIPADSLLRYPDHMWAPRFDEPHITFFSESTLKTLVESAGFQLQFLSTAGPNYRFISALRFKMPPLRETIVHRMPQSLFRFLRSRNITKAVRVQHREQSFFEYGGCRLWLRSIWKKQEIVSA
jgi:SAM-dependent methyltransferase